MSSELLNKNKVQSVIIKLDKDKPRELRFREYLDSKRREGMNMKEAVLQLYESHLEGSNININSHNSSRSDIKEEKESIKTTDQKENVDVSDFDMI